MMTLIVWAAVGLYAAPFYGIYLMLSRKQDENRVLGFFVTLFGCIAWIALKTR